MDEDTLKLRGLRKTARRLSLLLAGALLASCGLMSATARNAPGSAPRMAPPDASVQCAVAAVSQDRLREDLAGLVSFGTRHTRSETESATRGIGAARRWLHARFAEVSAEHGGLLEVESQSHLIPAGRRMPEPVELVNVVATLRGTDPGRVVVISGHYDSRNSTDENTSGDAPGANDDGSGTVAVLEAARAICAALAYAGPGGGPLRPRASIRFAAVAGEEQGLYGSKAMAAADRAAGTDVFAMITNDIVGGDVGGNGESNRGHLRIFSEGRPSGPVDASRTSGVTAEAEVIGSDNDATSRQLARAVREIAALYVPALAVQLVLRQDRYLRGGDHRAFNEQGYAAVRFTELHEHFDRQHQDVRIEQTPAGPRAFGDTLEHIDWVNLTDVTRLNAAVALALALAPPPPMNVRVDTSGLSHDTRLLWEASASELANPEALDHWLIRLRPTDAPDWTHAIKVPRRDTGANNGTLSVAIEHTLVGLSKDHWLFAVQSVDAAGRASVPVYPRPQL
ncbi:MAG: M28 family peptidase [Planctomycetota bacterium]